MKALHEVQLAEFEAGLALGLDPDSTQVKTESDADASQRITTLRSRWLHRRCSCCGHSFRLGDEVALATNGTVLHDMVGLRCAGGADANASDQDSKQAFYQGLDEAWPTPASACIERLEGNHYLLAPPRSGLARAACRICGHTFRPGDHVVICPCSPSLNAAERKCVAAVHRDTLNQLHCLDEWEKARSDDTCLGMS